MLVETDRACTKCGEPKPIEMFYPDPSCKGGRRSGCKDCELISARLYDAEHPEAASHRNSARRARSRNANGTHTLAEWHDLCEEYGNTCLCCGATDKPLTRDHIIPLIRGGSDSIDNLQPLCQPCNRAKGRKAIDYRVEGGLVVKEERGVRRLDLRETAEALDTSVDAIRKRIKRGTLDSERGPDGKVYVFLDEELDEGAPRSDTDRLISTLEEQLRLEREAHAEARRLLAAALERIPAIEPSESPETDAAPRPGTQAPPEPQTPEQTRPWWRRMFGG